MSKKHVTSKTLADCLETYVERMHVEEGLEYQMQAGRAADRDRVYLGALTAEENRGAVLKADACVFQFMDLA